MITLRISMTGKGYAPGEKWTRLGEREKHFSDLATAKAWLREEYGTAKRSPMYRDLKDGTTIQTGYVIGFRNADWSHSPVHRWLQQDWVEFSSSEVIDLSKRGRS